MYIHNRMTSFVAVVLCFGLHVTSVQGQTWPPSEQWLEDNKDSKSSEVIQIRCPDQAHCRPPGTCTQSEHDTLAKDMHFYYNKPRSCKLNVKMPPADPNNPEKFDCGEIKDKIETGYETTQRRAKVMNDCFRGGDQPHLVEAARVHLDWKECESLLADLRKYNMCR